MIIQCEECRTKFNIDETFIKNEGSKVKCSCCKHVFMAYPPKPIDAEDQHTVIVSEEEPDSEEESFDAGLEEMGFDDIMQATVEVRSAGAALRTYRQQKYHEDKNRSRSFSFHLNCRGN